MGVERVDDIGALVLDVFGTVNGAARLLGLPRQRVLMVAAHVGDPHADLSVASLTELAAHLGT